MSYRPFALILVMASLVGCSTTSHIFGKSTKVPVVEYVEVVKYVPLPKEHLRPCPATRAADRSVKEYVRVANTNTPALIQCDKQIEAIRKLQP